MHIYRKIGALLVIYGCFTSPLSAQQPNKSVVLLNFEDPAPTESDDQNGAESDNLQKVLSSSYEKQDLRKLVLRQSFEEVGDINPAPRLPAQSKRAGDCLATPKPLKASLSMSARKRRNIYFPLVRQAACRYNIPVGLFDSLVIQESRYNPVARSHANAYGLTQLMPGTAKELRVDRYNIEQNIDGGARYFSQQRRRFRSNSLALAAYNSGPNRVNKIWRVPNIKETKNYVHVILSDWRDSLRLEQVRGRAGRRASSSHSSIRRAMLIE